MPAALFMPSVPAPAPSQPSKPNTASAADERSSTRPERSFDDVYAEQRRQGTDERPDKDVTSKTASDADATAKSTREAAPKDQAVAASGNDLPDEDAAPADGALDPLLLLGLEGDAKGELDPALEDGLTDADAEGDDSAVDPLALLTSLLPPLTPPPTATAQGVNADAEGEVQGDADPQLMAGLNLAGSKEPKGSPLQAKEGGGESAVDGLLDEAPAADAAALPDAGEEQMSSKLFASLLKDAQPAAESGGRGESPRLDAAAGIAAQAAPVHAPQARAAAALVPGQALATQQAGFGEGVVDRVMWMSSRNLKSAEIQLHPAELGRLEVRIDLQQDQTQVTFASPHAAVRDALESQMGRLREMFVQQGMNLADVNVSDQSRGWQQGQGGGEGRQGGGAGAVGGAEDDVALTSVQELNGVSAAVARSLVDYYA